MTFYLQIDNGEPFLPDEVRTAGVEFGLRETTKDTDTVRNFALSSKVARINYVKDGLQFDDFYKQGEWLSHNEKPLFKVSELLEFKK